MCINIIHTVLTIHRHMWLSWFLVSLNTCLCSQSMFGQKVLEPWLEFANCAPVQGRLSVFHFSRYSTGYASALGAKLIAFNHELFKLRLIVVLPEKLQFEFFVLISQLQQSWL